MGAPPGHRSQKTLVLRPQLPILSNDGNGADDKRPWRQHWEGVIAFKPPHTPVRCEVETLNIPFHRGANGAWGDEAAWPRSLSWGASEERWGPRFVRPLGPLPHTPPHPGALSPLWSPAAPTACSLLQAPGAFRTLLPWSLRAAALGQCPTPSTGGALPTAGQVLDLQPRLFSLTLHIQATRKPKCVTINCFSHPPQLPPWPKPRGLSPGLWQKPFKCIPLHSSPFISQSLLENLSPLRSPSAHTVHCLPSLGVKATALYLGLFPL